MTDTNDSLEPVERRGCRVNLFNVLTAMVVVAAFAVLLFFVALLLTPDNFLSDLMGREDDEPTPTRLSRAVVPTETPIVEQQPERIVQLPPTRTPFSGQVIATSPPLVGTPRPTLTPSITPTFPPPTPTRTPTPTPTETQTPGPSPTPSNTRSAFPFTKDLVSPQYLQNYANNAGCDWLGIAGEVFDLNGNPVPRGQYVVRVWDSGIDTRVPVGGAPAYGPSGYEQFLFNQLRIQDNNIQLLTANGTAVSQAYRVQTRASCNQNLLYFVFVQNH